MMNCFLQCDIPIPMALIERFSHVEMELGVQIRRSMYNNVKTENEF
jgi:hypothetical protein